MTMSTPKWKGTKASIDAMAAGVIQLLEQEHNDSEHRTEVAHADAAVAHTDAGLQATKLDTIHDDLVGARAVLQAFKDSFQAFGPGNLYWLALGNLIQLTNTKLDTLHADAVVAHADQVTAHADSVALKTALALLHTDNVTALAKLEAIRAAIVAHV